MVEVTMPNEEPGARSEGELGKILEDLTNGVELNQLTQGLMGKDPRRGAEVRNAYWKSIEPFSGVVNRIVTKEQHSHALGQRQNTLGATKDLEDLCERIQQAAQGIGSNMALYLSYSDMMARKEAEFQAFAREAEQRFLDELMDGLQEYLDQKRASLSDRVEKELSAAERIADATYRPIAHVLSRAVKLKTRTSWNQPFVERILDAELGPEVLTRDLATIAETAKNNFESAWQKKMEESAPNLEMLRALSGSALHSGHDLIGFDLEISTQVFVSGMTAALAGTFALAAGWHTLAYAMANVFPPAAIMTALLGTVTFVLTGKRARENRKERVRKAIEQYHALLCFS